MGVDGCWCSAVCVVCVWCVCVCVCVCACGCGCRCRRGRGCGVGLAPKYTYRRNETAINTDELLHASFLLVSYPDPTLRLVTAQLRNVGSGYETSTCSFHNQYA